MRVPCAPLTLAVALALTLAVVTAAESSPFCPLATVVHSRGTHGPLPHPCLLATAGSSHRQLYSVVSTRCESESDAPLPPSSPVCFPTSSAASASVLLLLESHAASSSSANTSHVAALCLPSSPLMRSATAPVSPGADALAAALIPAPNARFDMPAVVAGVVACVEDASGGEVYARSLPASPVPMASQAIEVPEWARPALVGSAPNPKVLALVNGVIADTLMGRVGQLAAIWTRLSWTTGAYDAAQAIHGWMSDMGLSVNFQSYRSDFAANVIAELPGKVDASKILIVCAHFDSRSADIEDPEARAPGADDNGSGTAALLTLAQIAADYTPGFAYTIRFVAVSGEEQGLLGSKAAAAAAAAAGEDIMAAVNADMLGWCPDGEENVVGYKDKEVTPWLVKASKALVAMYVHASDGAPVTTADSSSCCSDYISWLNITASIGMFESSQTASAYPAYHSSNDLPTQLVPAHFQVTARAVAATVFALADPQ